MLRSLVSLFNKNTPYEILETEEPRHTNVVYRDELNKIKKPSRSSKPKSSTQIRSHGSGGGGGVEKKGVIRVKVVMTKQEAARLLSKCKEGGVLGFKDAVNELVQIPMNRVSILPSDNNTSSHGAALKSIPEEF